MVVMSLTLGSPGGRAYPAGRPLQSMDNPTLAPWIRSGGPPRGPEVESSTKEHDRDLCTASQVLRLAVTHVAGSSRGRQATFRDAGTHGRSADDQVLSINAHRRSGVATDSPLARSTMTQ